MLDEYAIRRGEVYQNSGITELILVDQQNADRKGALAMIMDSNVAMYSIRAESFANGVLDFPASGLS